MMQLHARFWDDSTSTRKARIEAPRLMDRSRSFLVPQAIDTMLPMAGLAGCFVSFNTQQGVRACYIFRSGKGKTFGVGSCIPLVNGSGSNGGCTGGYALAGLRSS